MAIPQFQSQSQPQSNIQIHHIPHSSYIDFVRFIPTQSSLTKLIALSLYSPDSLSSTIQLHSLSNPSSTLLSPLSSFTPNSRPLSLKTTQTLIAFSSSSPNSITFVPVTSDYGFGTNAVTVEGDRFHVGGILGLDLVGSECVSVGEDGRVNVVTLRGGDGGGGGVEWRRVFDGDGLVEFSAVRWGSSVEFATAGFGFGMQWWDQRRKAGEPVLQLKGNWAQKASSGIVHSIDIHPSRKHTCVAGGSSGTVFAWDLRWPQQPIVLSGVGIGERPTHPVSESEVWEVQYDCHLQSSHMASVSSSKMLPVMMCSEDGILAVLEQGAEPIELLEEPCAINSFDIDKQNYSDIVCSLEWESLAIISRS